MGIFDKVLTRMGYMKAPQEYPKWLLQAADVESLSYPQYTDSNNKLSYYQRVSWVNIAVDKVATIGSGAKWNVKRRDGEQTVDIPNHPFERLLDAPNPTMSRADLIYATLAYMSVCNSAYWWVNYGTNKQPVELWLIPSKQISPIPDGRMYIKGYEYNPGDGQTIMLETGEVIAFNGFNPDSMFTGMSNLDPLRTIMDSDIGMQNWNKKLFVRSNGRLPGILAFADPIPDDDWSLIQQDVDKAAAMRNFMMLRNVKAGGVQWLQATASQKDMEFLNSRLANRDEIYSAIAPGLSSILSVNATEANARIGKTTLIDFKVYPMLQKIASVLTTKIMPAYDDNLIIEPEDIRVTDKVLRLQEMAEYSKTHTIDEVRSEYWQDDPLGNGTGSLLVAAAQSPALPMLSEPEGEQTFETGNAALDVTSEFDAVTAKDMRPALLELEKWERKSAKAGKVAEFTAYNIPAEIVEAVKGGAGFDKAREMLAAGPDISGSEVSKVIKMLELNLAAIDTGKKPTKAGDNYNFPVTVNVPAPVVQSIPAPEVNITNEVQPTPVQNTVHIPELKSGDVTVNVPEQKAPIVNVPEQKQPIVNVHLPIRDKLRTKVTRDSSGKINGIDEM